MVYPPLVWQQLMASGKYGIKVLADGKTALIVKLTAEEIGARISKMSKPPESKFFVTGKRIFEDQSLPV